MTNIWYAVCVVDSIFFAKDNQKRKYFPIAYVSHSSVR